MDGVRKREKVRQREKSGSGGFSRKWLEIERISDVQEHSSARIFTNWVSTFLK